MIFTTPIAIGVIVGAASAYFLKDNTIKEWLTDKSNNRIFKKKNQQEAVDSIEEVEVDEIEIEVDEIEVEVVDGQWSEDNGDYVEDADEGGVPESATEEIKDKVKAKTEAIKKKSAEALEDTTKKAKEAVDAVKEKTEVVLEETTIKVKEAAEKMKKIIESFKK